MDLIMIRAAAAVVDTREMEDRRLGDPADPLEAMEENHSQMVVQELPEILQEDLVVVGLVTGVTGLAAAVVEDTLAGAAAIGTEVAAAEGLTTMVRIRQILVDQIHQLDLS